MNLDSRVNENYASDKPAQQVAQFAGYNKILEAMRDASRHSSVRWDGSLYTTKVSKDSSGRVTGCSVYKGNQLVIESSEEKDSTVLHHKDDAYGRRIFQNLQGGAR